MKPVGCHYSVAQQARNLSIAGVLDRFRLLVRDRDAKFTAAFDTVVQSERIRVILTPIRTPVANAYAERFVRTIRSECLDWILIRSERHLQRVVCEYLAHYNATTTSGSLPDSQIRILAPHTLHISLYGRLA